MESNLNRYRVFFTCHKPKDEAEIPFTFWRKGENSGLYEAVIDAIDLHHLGMEMTRYFIDLKIDEAVAVSSGFIPGYVNMVIKTSLRPHRDEIHSLKEKIKKIADFIKAAYELNEILHPDDILIYDNFFEDQKRNLGQAYCELLQKEGSIE